MGLLRVLLALSALIRPFNCSQGSRLMASTRLLGCQGLAPALGRVQRSFAAARVVAKADGGGGNKNKSKGKKDEGGEGCFEWRGVCYVISITQQRRMQRRQL